MANGPASVADRRADLSDRMSSGRQDWQQRRDDRTQNGQDRRDDRQDWRDQNREDWQQWADDKIADHGDWYHDCWGDDWYPGAGWGYMWDNYPVAAAFGLTAWGVNRIGYGWGYYDYSNPYAVASTGYDYSQPLVDYGAASAPAASATDVAAAPASQPSDAAMAAFDEARSAFKSGDYEKSLSLLEGVLREMPNDSAVHEFRALVLFALGKYSESAAAVYAVLSAGPGWDWTTMSGLYANVDEYTAQLRALENFARTNPNSAEAHFLLGYHYLTGGFAENALAQFQQAGQQLPNDRLIKQLIAMTTPPSATSPETPASPPAPATVPPDKLVKAEQLNGSWSATSDGARFDLNIKPDGTFSWGYVRGDKRQTVGGVFALDQNTLALEPDSGGTMLAQIDLTNPNQMQFNMIGGDANDPGLRFAKASAPPRPN